MGRGLNSGEFSYTPDFELSVVVMGRGLNSGEFSYTPAFELSVAAMRRGLNSGEFSYTPAFGLSVAAMRRGLNSGEFSYTRRKRAVLYSKKEIVKRYEKNPILTADDMPFASSGIYNSGVTKFNGKYLMLCRVESIDISNYFVVATSDDGYHFDVREEPIALPDDEEFKEYTEEMIYDPRITNIEGDYYVLFACHSSHGVRIGMLKTRDFDKFDWRGFISAPDNRNGALFPEKINGLYARLDRPITPNDQGDIWISYSPDLVFWGKSKCVARCGKHGTWHWQKIGAGAVPIKTEQGWLEIWHAVHILARYQYVYHIGVMLLDLDDPSKVVARAKAPIISPRELYERVGLTSNVVFTSGAIVEDDGEVKIYYGGADTVQCVATAQLDELIEACFER